MLVECWSCEGCRQRWQKAESVAPRTRPAYPGNRAITRRETAETAPVSAVARSGHGEAVTRENPRNHAGDNENWDF